MHIGQGSSPTSSCRYRAKARRPRQATKIAEKTRRGERRIPLQFSHKWATAFPAAHRREEIMVFNPLPLMVGTLAFGAAATAGAAEVTVLSGGAVRSAFTVAASDWEKRTGHKVRATFAPAGEMQKRLAAGERFDIVVLPAENFAGIEKEGLVDPAT